jgi:hypothetical protein
MATLKILAEEIGGALAIGATVIFSPLLRGWYARWGATDDEFARRLPGDEIVPEPLNAQLTHAITIHAPTHEVWPWLVQMGQGRGGLYSYEMLENLIGCQMHNAEEIIPELQHLDVGDSILFMPTGLGQLVKEIEPERALVLITRDPKTGQPVPPEVFAATWTFVLQPIDERTTRLIVRSRSRYPRTFASVLLWRVIVEPMQFIMERKMLLGIRERAERVAQRETANVQPHDHLSSRAMKSP